MSWLEGCSLCWRCSGCKLRFERGDATLRIGWSARRHFWRCSWRFFPIPRFGLRGACSSSKQYDQTYRAKIIRAQVALLDSVGNSCGAALWTGGSARERLRRKRWLSRRVAVYAGDLSHDVPRAFMDDAAVRRLRNGGRIEPALPLLAEQRTGRFVRCV